MARLTDSNGLLLGGLDTSSPPRLTPPADTPATLVAPAALVAPPTPPLSPEYGPTEIVFALECSYGSLAYLTYASAIAAPPFSEAGEGREPVSHRDCQTLIEEPDERHHCPACGGYYCARHASPLAHDCRAVMRVNS